VAVYISLFAFVFMTFFFFSGLALLEFFGISLPAFRIAGGVILFLMGLEMARDDFTAMFADAAEGAESEGARAYARRRFERLVVPFAMPLLIGPGAISSVVIFASEAKQFGLQGMAVGIGVIAAISLVTMLCFWLTPVISKLLGRIGLTIIVRVLGLILCAMAVQFIIIGVSDAARGGIIKTDVVTPYTAEK
jgi:multiple antibiotic resistance protein